jgi:predicted tellurium resistance membrane protein TerC
MALLTDPQTWLSFLTLSLLEIVLGIDNLIFLSILVNRLPESQRRRGRALGLGLAMVTRIALLFCLTWLASLIAPLFTVFGNEISWRDLILFGGGAFLIVKSAMEIRGMLAGGHDDEKKSGPPGNFWLIILQISLIDIVFSLDSVLTAIGLARHIEVMIAAIVASMLVMLVVSSAVSAFISRYPTIKALALAFLIMVGGALIASALDVEIPKGYLYFAMAFSVAVEWLNIKLRARA